MTEETATNRIPPQNTDAEQALLGAILSNNRALEKVSEFLLPEHFVNPAHKKIYQACRTYIEQGRIADPITLKPLFANDEDLKNVGGADYLMRLATSSITIINAGDYGRQILDRYIRRRLIDVGTDMVNEAYTFKVGEEAISQVEVAEKKLYEIANEGETTGGPKQLYAALHESLTAVESAMKNPTGLSGVTTGLTDLDKLLGGLHNSDLIVLAGRPGMGKSALATTIAFNAARFFEEENKKPNAEKKSVALFSLEMSAEQLATRILSAKAKVSGEDMRTGKISNDQFDDVAAGVSLLSKVPLYIDETPGINVTAIGNRARRLKRDKNTGLGLIVIDYLQLIMATGKTENRVQELSEMTRRLKMMAKDLNVPVLVLSQLSRSVEQRDNKKPMLSDLRESGSIEQDADIVMFVYREYYYMKQAGEPVRHANETPEKYALRVAEWNQKLLEVENQAKVIVAKNRHGRSTDIDLFFSAQYGSFTDLEKAQVG